LRKEERRGRIGAEENGRREGRWRGGG